MISSLVIFEYLDIKVERSPSNVVMTKILAMEHRLKSAD
jgi:hypothetical protein